MSTITALLGIPQKGTRIDRSMTSIGSTATIFLDATVKEMFDAPSEVTQHPVERGVDISDHIILRPQKLSISGKITETPFTQGGQIAGVVSSVAAKIGANLGGALGGVNGSAVGGAAATVGASKTLAGVINQPKSVTGANINDPESGDRNYRDLPTENSRLRDAVAEFLNLRETRQAVTIITGLKQYKNFALTSFKVTRDQSTGQSITVDLEFQEIATAESASIAIPKTPKGLPNNNQGKKGGVEATPAQNKSVLAKGYDFLAG